MSTPPVGAQVVIVVVIVPPVVTPRVAAAVVTMPTQHTLPNRVWRTIALDKVTTRLAVRGATNSALTLQEGKVFHYLEVVAQ